MSKRRRLKRRQWKIFQENVKLGSKAKHMIAKRKMSNTEKHVSIIIPNFNTYSYIIRN